MALSQKLKTRTFMDAFKTFESITGLGIEWVGDCFPYGSELAKDRLRTAFGVLIVPESTHL